MGKRVLYAAIHAWTSPLRVGSHAIAEQFAKRGWEVAYVSAPITPLNFLRPTGAQFPYRWREYCAGGGLDLNGRLRHYVPFSVAAPANRPGFRSEWLFRNWHRLTVPNLLSAVRRTGFGEVDLLFLDTIYQPFWLDAIDHKRCIVRMADFNAGFPGYGKAAAASELSAIDRADLVLTASAALREQLLSQGRREVMYVPNGLDLARFSNAPLQRPEEYRKLDGAIAVYVGDFGPWVDLTLIENCARAFPGANFVIIGPYAKNAGDFPANVHFLGTKAQSDVPAYLHYADAGLIPFRSDRCPRLISHVNPLKLYEYLAAGLPVVSTRWKEIENLASPAKLCATPEAFVAAVGETLSVRARPAECRRYAEKTDWSVRLQPLFDYLG